MVRDAVREHQPLDLRTERPAVQIAMHGGVAQRAREADRVGAPGDTHVEHVGGDRHAGRRLVSRAVGIGLHDDELFADPQLVARQLPADAGRPREHAAVRRDRERQQEIRVIVLHRGARESLREIFGDEAGIEITGDELRMREQRCLERDVARDALDHERVERVAHLRDRVCTVGAMGDQLADHRVVEHRDLTALVDAGVNADATCWWHPQRGKHRLLGRLECDEPARARQEAAQGILGVDAALDRPALAVDLFLREPQRLACRHTDHLLDQIEPGDALGDRVLDLQPGVHLQEVEALVLADHELDGAGALIVHRPGERNGLFAHRLARRFADERRRRLFDHLLVASLDRALALPQVDAMAMRIAQHLNLDVARLLDELLDEHPVVTEAVAGFVAARGVALERLFFVERHAQPFAAAARRGLDHYRVADVLCDLDRVFGRVDRGVVARDRADTGRTRELLRLDLVAHCRDRSVLRADEDDAFLFDPAREPGVFAEKAVAGVHRLRARLFAGGDDLVHHEVRLAARRRADEHGFVGEVDMQRIAICFRIHRHRCDAHLLRRLDDAAGDLAAVGNQDLGEHRFVS